MYTVSCLLSFVYCFVSTVWCLLSCVLLPISYGLWFMILWISGGKDDSMNQSVNDKAVYRTAPATPGLLIITCRHHTGSSHRFWWNDFVCKNKCDRHQIVFDRLSQRILVGLVQINVVVKRVKSHFQILGTCHLYRNTKSSNLSIKLKQFILFLNGAKQCQMLHPLCHMSHVMCHMSCVMYHVSTFTCHMSLVTLVTCR